MRPFFSPNTVRKEDSDQDATSETAGKSQCDQEIQVRVRQVHLEDQWVRDDAEAIKFKIIWTNHKIHKTQSCASRTSRRHKCCCRFLWHFSMAKFANGFVSVGAAKKKSMENRRTCVLRFRSACVENDNSSGNHAWATTPLKYGNDDIHGQVCFDGQTSAHPLAHMFRPHRDPNHERNSDMHGMHGTV